MPGDRARNCRTLALPAGELGRDGVFLFAQLKLIQQLIDALFDLFSGIAAVAQWKRDVLKNRHILNQRKVLHHEADLLIPEVRKLTGRKLGDLFPLEKIGTTCRLAHTAQNI